MTITRIDLGTEYLGGINKPKSEDVGKIAVVALDSLSRPNLSYQTQTATVANDAFATALASHLRGAGLTVDASGNLATRMRPRYKQRRDYFDTGNASSGTIGNLGWNLLGSGTPAYSRLNPAGSSSGNKGELATSAGANDRSTLCLAMTESGGITQLGGAGTLIQCVWNHDNVLTNKRAFFGFHNDFATEAASVDACLGIYYDSSAGSTYRVVARNSSAGSPVDTGVTVPANTDELITIYSPSAGVWQIYIGNTQVGGNLTTNLPTPTMNVGFRLETLSAASKTLNIGYYGESSLLVGAFDDDTFLEA
jgi:hypothetical protein